MSTVPETARSRLAAGFRLDSLWAETMGIDPSDTKERPLRLVAELLNGAGVAYALIGGVAVQIRTTEPRTTLDIDVAVARFADVPRAALLAAGFDHTGRHEHSDNWRAPPAGPDSLRTAVQFSAEDVGIADAVSNAELTDLADGLRMRVATPADLIVLKLAAAAEPRRRPSKRQHDLADVVALMEEYPELRTPKTLARLRDVRLSLQALDDG
jgi:predicted nucleotidyltransferase